MRRPAERGRPLAPVDMPMDDDAEGMVVPLLSQAATARRDAAERRPDLREWVVQQERGNESIQLLLRAHEYQREMLRAHPYMFEQYALRHLKMDPARARGLLKRAKKEREAQRPLRFAVHNAWKRVMVSHDTDSSAALEAVRGLLFRMRHGDTFDRSMAVPFCTTDMALRPLDVLSKVCELATIGRLLVHDVVRSAVFFSVWWRCVMPHAIIDYVIELREAWQRQTVCLVAHVAASARIGNY